MSLATAWRRVEAYTKRSMSYDEDAMSGILGVLAALRLDHSIYHFWGLLFSDSPEMRTLRNRRAIYHYYAASISPKLYFEISQYLPDDDQLSLADPG